MQRRIVPDIVSDQDISFLKPDDRVSSAIDLMTDRKIGAVLIAEEGRLAGIFTERDVLHRLVKAKKDLVNTPLRDVMTADPMCVQPDAPALAALQIMTEKGFRHLPVVTAEGEIVGIVSIRDLYGAVLSELEEDVRQRDQLIFDTGYGVG
ncbi:MAG: CBS domain-containing protein [Limibacillus sp.]|jgi:CBS domain-containing protein